MPEVTGFVTGQAWTAPGTSISIAHPGPLPSAGAGEDVVGTTVYDTRDVMQLADASGLPIARGSIRVIDPDGSLR